MDLTGAAHSPELPAAQATELLRRVRRQQMGRASCLLITSSQVAAGQQDQQQQPDASQRRGSTGLQPHAVSCLAEMDNAAWQHSVVGILHGHCMPDLVQYAELWADQGKLVIVSALDTNCQRKAFEGVAQLCPLAESVVKLAAVCEGCHQSAAFTFQRDPEGDLSQVSGGRDKYAAMCRSCHRTALLTQAIQQAATATPKRSTRRTTRASGVEPRLTSPSKNPRRRQSLTALVR